jgi:c-di-GMP-binding flagellar brake protein YcgR
MLKTEERREYSRFPVSQGAIVLRDEAGEEIMDKITIQNISLGGLGFVSDTEYQKHKVYNLKLKADLPHEKVNLDFKIAIVRVLDKDHQTGQQSYGAVYRSLSKSQSDILREIIEYQSGLDAALSQPQAAVGAIS